MKKGKENSKNSWNGQKEKKQQCISHVVAILFCL